MLHHHLAHPSEPVQAAFAVMRDYYARHLSDHVYDRC